MKRSAAEILETLNPIKSSKRYDFHWDQFLEFTECSTNKKPTEENLIVYFDHLKCTKKLAASTIWSIYSMLNYKMQLFFGEKLQKYPRLTTLLKSLFHTRISIHTRERMEKFTK